VAAEKVIGKDHHMMLRTRGTTEAELLRSYILQSYLRATELPSEIVTACPPRESGTLETWLAERAGRPVRLRTARMGARGRLLEAARENAHLRLEEEELRERRHRARVHAGVYELQEKLDLPRTPYRIEGYDISNLQASYPVASQVCFQDGMPLKSGYRRFRIKQTQGPDDFAMIGEAIRRRAQHWKAKEGVLPDLILIDGGVGQVGRAAEVLREEGFEEILLLGLAKREELVVIPGASEPVRLPRQGEALRLLQRVRDEAHRFAVSYHRNLRSKGQVRSGLDPLRGIGPKRRALLLQHFGSLEAIRRAAPEALARVPGIGMATARRILEQLQERERRPSSASRGEEGTG
jgi:excinuclease ABC subunit C